MVTLIALPVLIYRQTGSTFLTALVSALEAVPYLTFGLLAGALSDRWDRRAMMVGADLADTVLLGSVPVAYWLGILTVPHILVVAFAGPAVAVFFDGANFGALPVLVGRDRIAEANAAIWGSASAGRDGDPGRGRGGAGRAVARDADRRRRAQLRGLGDVRAGDLAPAAGPGSATAEAHPRRDPRRHPRRTGVPGPASRRSHDDDDRHPAVHRRRRLRCPRRGVVRPGAGHRDRRAGASAWCSPRGPSAGSSPRLALPRLLRRTSAGRDRARSRCRSRP